MLTTDRNDPDLHKTRPDSQHEKYLVLSEEERAKGFVRPLRRAYRHVGKQPTYTLLELTEGQKRRYPDAGYVKYEKYPDDPASTTVGRFWTAKDLLPRCGTETRMGLALCETYARNPKFYGATSCSQCKEHFPVDEFVWVEDGEVVGS